MLLRLTRLQAKYKSRVKYEPPYPKEMFIINCKNYEAIAGTGLRRLLDAAGAVSKKHGVDIAVSPPQHMLGQAAGGPVPILAQHTDDAGTGSTTGYVVAELLKKARVAGSLINHSEHRVPRTQIGSAVSTLQRLRMLTVVCVRDAAEAKRHARLGPDYIAIEPPELIGSGKAVSAERPELIEAASAAVRSAGNRTRLLCGAGIVSGEDVSRAIELGAEGILVASGIIKSRNWRQAISALAKPMA